MTTGRPKSSTMDVCKYCREPMGWPRPVGVVYGDRTAAHHACDERAEQAYQAAKWKERLAAAVEPVERYPVDQGDGGGVDDADPSQGTA